MAMIVFCSAGRYFGTVSFYELRHHPVAAPSYSVRCESEKGVLKALSEHSSIFTFYYPDSDTSFDKTEGCSHGLEFCVVNRDGF